jgi:hypothetical protein
MTFLTIFVLFLQTAPIPGMWEKVDGLTPGIALRVEMKSGSRMQGTFKSSSNDALILTNDAGTDVTLPKAEISAVIKPKGQDGLRNGVLIGAAAGFASGFVALMAYDRGLTASGYRFDSEAAAIYTSAGLLGAGIGAVTGALIDRAIKGDEVLFRAR